MTPTISSASAALDYPLLPMDKVDSAEAASAAPAIDWLVHGYVARRNLTLLTSLWKAGKTTWLTGLLQRLAGGGHFLDREVAPAKALVISEEPRETWADRLRRMPVGPHAQLLTRPFRRRPTPTQWNDLIDFAGGMCAEGKLDLLVVDPLARFLPGSTESDLGAVFEFLDPLQRLAAAGAAVFVLHHPRRETSEEGSSARGAGGLLAAVDIIIELHRYGRLRSDDCRRRLFAVSRFPQTPRHLVYEWDPESGAFTGLGDPTGARFADNWKQLQTILAGRKKAATHHELLMDWPPDQERPSASLLYQWLNRAYEEKRVRREGAGLRLDPYRYRLPNEDDAYFDRGELPPIRGLSGMF